MSLTKTVNVQPNKVTTVSFDFETPSVASTN